MVKHKSLIIFTCASLLLVSMSLACGQAQQAAPAAPASKTSFEAVTYTNDEIGFSISYPKAWIKKPPTGDTLLQVASSPDTGADGLLISAVAAVPDIAAGGKTLLDNSQIFKQFGATVTVDSTSNLTLADGKTPAVEIESSTQIMNYKMNMFSIGATKGSKTVYVTTYTFRGDRNKALLLEVIKTLAFK